MFLFSRSARVCARRSDLECCQETEYVNIGRCEWSDAFYTCPDAYLVNEGCGDGGGGIATPDPRVLQIGSAWGECAHASWRGVLHLPDGLTACDSACEAWVSNQCCSPVLIGAPGLHTALSCNRSPLASATQDFPNFPSTCCVSTCAACWLVFVCCDVCLSL